MNEQNNNNKRSKSDYFVEGMEKLLGLGGRDEREIKRIAFAATAALMFLMTALAVSALLRLFNVSEGLDEFTLLVITAVFFYVDAKDWRSVKPPVIHFLFFKKDISQKSVFKRILMYTWDSLLDGALIIGFLALLGFATGGERGLYSEDAFVWYEFVWSFVFLTIVVAAISFVIHYLIGENDMRRYRKEQARIAEEERIEREEPDKKESSDSGSSNLDPFDL